MQRLCRKYICYIVAFFMLLSGMCLTNVKTDSYFVYNTVSSNNSYVDNYEGEFVNNDSCTIDMLGVYNPVRTISQARRIISRIDIRTSIYLVCVEMFLHSKFNFSAVIERIDSSEVYCKAALLNYIHNKDGKK